MYVNVVVKRKPVWWAWGDGGHRIEQGVGGPYPVTTPPVVAGQLNNPHPHWSTNVEELTAMPKNYSGWVLKHHERKQTIEEFNQGIAAVEHDFVYFFLRRLLDVSDYRVVIRLDSTQLRAMRAARKDFLELTDKEDDEAKTPMIISELALYDEELKFIGSINPFHAVYSGVDSLEIAIDTRSQAEIDASNAAWERTERERAERGALM